MSQKSWQLNRRAFLAGAGVTLGLPYLQCMAKASPGGQTPPNRVFCGYFPFGVCSLESTDPNAEWGWWPLGEGREFRFTRSTQPLEAHRNQVTFFQGFQHPRVKVGGHQSADFFLTGVDTRASQNTISVDQAAAAHLGGGTRLASLVLSSDGGVGSAGMSHTLSYNATGRPLPGLANPTDVYERLFGGNSPAVRRQLELNRSALDLMRESSTSLQNRLGQEDRRTLDQYLESVRTLETDVSRSQEWLDAARVTVDSAQLTLSARADGADPRSYLRVMYDLIFHAFRTDTTRVATFQTGSMRAQLSAASRWPRLLGVGGDAHGLAHGAKKDFQTKSKYDSALLEQFAHLIKRLGETREGDATLLDRTVLLYGSSNSSTHNNSNYPLVLAGGRALGFQHGQYVKNPRSRPMADILFTMLQGLGVPARSFADSTGAIAEVRRQV